MCDIKGIVIVDIPVGEVADVVEEMIFQRVGVFHDECMQVQPPKPNNCVSKNSIPNKEVADNHTILREGTSSLPL